MSFDFLLRGLIVGISLAAPVGPMAVLCIRRTLVEGHFSGLITGMGIATADALYGCIAGFGLTFISSLLLSQQIWIRLLGGAFLCYLSITTFLAQPTEQGVPLQSPEAHRGVQGQSIWGAYLSALFLTLTNPLTILSFVGVFAGLGLASNGSDYRSAGLLVLGVFLGSALWWLALSSIASRFRHRFKSHTLRWVNRLSGSLIGGFGLLALLSLWR
ncbi:LysE family translocator [Leptolyngbya sp. FACHB-261]|uniref:LysE family translocator n=1 Tax=Leptolyngbya sp. FACHB-261 TaxID=2692806 RepID=UPI00168526E8|nr:LysE family transporter [Leptolyngbya sp. FACHB-261]MBD2104718.1 LysE family transporter [Leptolyngbya sp. FACHB-261]